MGSAQKPQIILLSDSLSFGEIGNTRYMGTYSLAGQLEQAGYRVLVIDYFTRHPHFFKFIESFLSSDLLFVGISSTFLAPFVSIKTSRPHRSVGVDLYYKGELWFEEGEDLKSWLSQFKKLIKTYSPNSKIVLGGAKAQFAVWRNQFYSDIDYICLGPADRTLVKLASALQNKSEVSQREFKGIQILENNEDTENKFCPSIRWSSHFAVQPGESLPMEISRGCVFNCKFCHYDKKESFRKNSNDLKDELIFNYENYGTDTYHFCDDCFNDHPQKVENFCNTFMSLPFKIEWVAYSRVDVAVKFPDTMRMMIESGARGLYFGLESFNHQVALKAGKGTPTDKVKEFLIDFKEKYSRECLIEGSFIVGLPGETRETQMQTSDWLMENPVLDFLTIGPLGIMPYVPDLDKLTFDYAEYSRNPEKYGFKEIDYGKRYWEHDTFNSLEATQLATEIKERWNQQYGFQKIKTIWLYPHLKSLGYSKEEIFNLVRNQEYAEAFPILEAVQKFDEHMQNYWDSL